MSNVPRMLSFGSAFEQEAEARLDELLGGAVVAAEPFVVGAGQRHDVAHDLVAVLHAHQEPRQELLDVGAADLDLRHAAPPSGSG